MRVTLPESGAEVEALVRLEMPLPLPLAHVGELMKAVGQTAEQLGYTEVSWITAGPHAGCIAGIPPAKSS